MEINPTGYYGLDKGLVFIEHGQVQPWPGLVRVEESSNESNTTSIHYRGKRVGMMTESKPGNLRVYTLSYPEHMAEATGMVKGNKPVRMFKPTAKNMAFVHRTQVTDESHVFHIYPNVVPTYLGSTKNTNTDKPTLEEHTWLLEPAGYIFGDQENGYFDTHYVRADATPELRKLMWKDDLQFSELVDYISKSYEGIDRTPFGPGNNVARLGWTSTPKPVSPPPDPQPEPEPEPEPGEANPVTIVGSVGENVTTDAFTPTIPNATTGDTIIIAANTKAVGGSTLTAPAGFTTLVDGYWKGTQRSWVLAGPWSDDLAITADQPLEFGYAAVAVRGATSVTTGTVKDRETEPAESTTVTAPAVEHGTNDLAIGIAFERTSATETPEQVTVNDGWTIEHYTAQGTNYQTTLIGVGGTGDMVATYPNPQNLNGAGVQVVAHAAPAPADTPVDTFLANRPFYVAHRLGGTEFPEMTVTGMQASIDAGFQAYEYSVFRSRDGVYVGSHDWTTNRTSGVRHEIWDTDWATIRGLNQATGRFTRLEEIVEMMPKGTVLFLDHKATSSKAQGNADEQRSERELFDLVERLFPDATKQVVFKMFHDSTMDVRARERGYLTNVMLYRGELAGADLTRWDVLGMEWNAPDEYWAPLRATGKPTIAHIIDANTGQRDTAIERGTQGFMSSLPTLVSPKTHPAP